MKVIINADDFGYTKAVTEGIIEGYHRGIIRSTTALCNMEYVEYGKKLLKDCPNLAVGVHLTLTLGKSLTQNQTLTDEFGYFYKPEMLQEHMFDPQEVYLEFKAQIEKYIEIFGRKPSHLDSHHGMHDFHDNYLATERLAKEYHLPVRRYSDYLFVKEFVNEKISVEGLIDILEKYKNKKVAKAMYFLTRTFPEYSYMCNIYPFLYKAPVLMPVMWIVRLICAPVTKMDRIRKEVGFWRKMGKKE